MKRRQFLRGAAAALAATLPLGCGGGDAPATALTADQQQAARSVATTLRTVIVSLRPLGSVTGGDLGLPGAPPAAGGGSCPAKTVTEAAGVTTVALNYDTGCAVEGALFSGQVSLAYDPAATRATVTFQNFAVDGEAVTGEVLLGMTAFSPLTVNAALDLTAGGVRVQGPVTAVVTDQSVTLTNAALTLGGATTYTITATNVTVAPAANASLLPQSGTVTIVYPVGSQQVRLAVTFTAQTPVNRTVQVSVNGGPPINYTLPE